MNDTSKSQSSSDPPRYVRCPDTIRFSLGEDTLTYSGVTKEVSILTPLQTSLLGLCGGARTLDEHAEFCCQQMSRVSVEQVREQLNILVERKALLSATFMRDSFARSDASDYTRGAITHVGVVTCDRPPQLRRCLSGYVANAQEHDKHCEFVVVDDTRDAGAREQTRRMLQGEAKESGAEITYLGLEEKLRLSKLLAGVGKIPQDIVDFGLFGRGHLGVSIGANRNALQLFTTGHQFLSTDDDVFCQIATAPQASNVLLVGNVDRHTQHWFFPDRQATFGAVQLTDIDLLSAHEEMLGANVAGYLATLKDDYEFNLRELDPPFVRSLVSGQAKVQITYTGTMGDSAFRSPAIYFGLEGASRARFLETEERYRLSCHSREVLRSVMRPVITKNSRCMTGACAYDNRDILPPFFPVERNEDGIFGQTLRATIKDSCFAHLPYVLLHDPPEQRSYAPDELLRPETYMHVSALVISAISSFEHSSRFLSTRDNIQKLGLHLSALGRLRFSDFEEFIRVQFFRELTAHVTALENHLRTHRREPVYWAEDVERYLDGFRQSVLKKENIHPRHFSGCRSPEEALLVSQQLIYDFGQCLYWWPVITDAASKTDMTQVLS